MKAALAVLCFTSVIILSEIFREQQFNPYN